MDRQVLCLLTVTILCSRVPIQAQQPFVHGSDVALTIRTDQKRYAVEDPIVVRYTIRNVSNAALFVPKSQWDVRCGDPPHFWARLEDNQGKHYEPGYAFSCLGPRPEDRMSISERMGKDAVLLRQGQALQGSFTFESKIFHLKPGFYRLEAVLYGWNQPFSESELSELSRIGAPFLIGEDQANTRVELRDASKK